VAGEDVLWFVTVTVAGPATDPAEVRAALERLSAKQAFVASARFSADRAEVRYWDEADAIAVVMGQGLRMWTDNEATIALPGWSVVGLEVVDRDTTRLRWEREDAPQVLVLGEIRPFEDSERR
jgi:hypothetical protein